MACRMESEVRKSTRWMRLLSGRQPDNASCSRVALAWSRAKPMNFLRCVPEAGFMTPRPCWLAPAALVIDLTSGIADILSQDVLVGRFSGHFVFHQRQI